jgi:hypothetical protein
LKKILKNTKGLSQVITTLLILVVSVLLAAAVTMYATSVTTNNMQQEHVSITKYHVWANGSYENHSLAGLIITNTGGRDIVVQKLQIRGVAASFANGEVYVVRADNRSISDMVYNYSIVSGTDNEITVTIDGSNYTFTKATEPITVKSGHSLWVYIKSPDSITNEDVGTEVEIVVYTINSVYTKTTLVETTNAA